MSRSIAHIEEQICPSCRQPFGAAVWRVVDVVERPELLLRLRMDTLHDLACPLCHHTTRLDRPLLVVRPAGGIDVNTPAAERAPRALIFSPAEQTSAAEDREMAAALVGELRRHLGVLWRDEWLETIQSVPRPLLPIQLAANPTGLLDHLRRTDPERYARIQEAGRGHSAAEAAELSALLDEIFDTQPSTLAPAARAAACRRALALIHRAKHPTIWAALHAALANSLRDASPRAESEAIFHHYEQALQIFTRRRHSDEWARVQTDLSTAHRLLAPSADAGPDSASARAEIIERALLHANQAMTVRTRVTHGREWSATACTLGLALLERVQGETAENIDRAIRHFAGALDVLRSTNDACARAQAHAYLGRALALRAHGDLELNRELALHHTHRALAGPVDTDGSGTLWAGLQEQLFALYWLRRRGDPTANVERAIRCGQRALRKVRRERAPAVWARLRTNLGLANSHRSLGDPFANSERAIHHHSQALSVPASAHGARIQAESHVNLAAALCRRLDGDPVNNTGHAIHHYQRALALLNRHGQTALRAEIQNNLGNAHLALSRLGAAAPRNRAGHHFQQALSLLQDEDAAESRALVQHNLADTLLEEAIAPQGDDGLEAAIHHYHEALRTQPSTTPPADRVRTEMQLAAAFGLRHRDDRTTNLVHALEIYRRALASGLRWAHPQLWATVQQRLAESYLQLVAVLADQLQPAAEKDNAHESDPGERSDIQRRLAKQRTELSDRAIHHLGQALTYLRPELFAQEAAPLADRLAALCLDAGSFQRAADACQIALTALDTIERIRSAGVAPATTRTENIAAMQRLCAMSALALSQLQRPQQAVQLLAWSHAVAAQFSPLAKRQQTAPAAVRRAGLRMLRLQRPHPAPPQHLLFGRMLPQPGGIADRGDLRPPPPRRHLLDAARADLDRHLDAFGREEAWSPRPDPATGAAAPDQPGATTIYLAATHWGGLALITHLGPSGPALRALPLPDLTPARLQMLPPNRDLHARALWDLAMGPLAAALHDLLPEGHTDSLLPRGVVLLATGPLAGLPLHAARPPHKDAPTFGARFTPAG